VKLQAWTYWTGRIGKLSVVVARTGMGPVNATASTALGIEHFHPKRIINQGTAGGHDPNLHLYDIVVGEKTIDCSAFASKHADVGQGTDPNRWSPLYSSIDGVQYKGFPGDGPLIEAALTTPYAKGKVVRGVVGSGFQFNRELDQIAWLCKTYGTDSEDMESAYVAGVAVGMHTPFVAIRILSDTEWSHPQFERGAGADCAAFVVDLLRRLGASR
jgi:adenosylhomocysteine nucleosidase